MKNVLSACIFVIFLAFLGCASTGQIVNYNKLSDEEIAAYNNDPNNTDKIVCRSDSEIGSRIPKRVCYKESSIDTRAQQDQQMLEEIQNRGLQNTRREIQSTHRDGG